MLVMDDRTIGIIYALKQGKYAADVNIRKFMNEWSHSDIWNDQGRNSIDNLLRQTIIDYLECCNNKNEISRYFNDGLWIRNEYDRMISFLKDIQVWENKIYINGMRDNPYSDFEVFKNE